MNIEEINKSRRRRSGEQEKMKIYLEGEKERRRWTWDQEAKANTKTISATAAVRGQCKKRSRVEESSHKKRRNKPRILSIYMTSILILARHGQSDIFNGLNHFLSPNLNLYLHHRTDFFFFYSDSLNNNFFINRYKFR